MRRLFSIDSLAYLVLAVAFFLGIWFLFYGEYFSGNFRAPDHSRAKEIQTFMTGAVLPLLTLGSTLLVIANLRSNTLQNFSNNFFKLIDQYHKLVDGFNTESKAWIT